jgi:hypothetical protein
VLDEFTEPSNDKWVPLLARSPADGKISGEIHVLVDRNFAKVEDKEVPLLPRSLEDGTVTGEIHEIISKELFHQVCF